jgi:hypothetical protein
MGLKAPMHDDERLLMKRIAREIRELTYFRLVTGASEAEVRKAIDKFGDDRSKVERELRRQSISDICDNGAQKASGTRTG